MSVFRSFIAVDLSHETQERLEQVTESFKEKLDNLPIKWVPVENIHLTLKFLGDVSESNQEMLSEIIQSSALSHHNFELSIGGTGAFPNESRPRVLWVGVEAPTELSSLQRSIDLETARLGYKSDRRPFSPHLTIGRVSRSANPREIRKISQVIKDQKIGFLSISKVREIHLFRSDLQPGGAVYTRLFTAPLQPKVE